MSNPSGGGHHVVVGGSVGGNFVVGDHNSIIGSPVTNYPRPTEAQLAAFQADVDALKAQAIAAVPPAEAVKAIEQLGEFHKAATAEKPDLTTMQKVRNWFVDHAPTMVGAVTGLLIHPVVGALVKSAGDAIAGEFKERFGGIPEVANAHE
jgi:hypothetical protein